MTRFKSYDLSSDLEKSQIHHRLKLLYASIDPQLVTIDRPLSSCSISVINYKQEVTRAIEKVSLSVHTSDLNTIQNIRTKICSKVSSLFPSGSTKMSSTPFLGLLRGLSSVPYVKHCLGTSWFYNHMSIPLKLFYLQVFVLVVLHFNFLF